MEEEDRRTGLAKGPHLRPADVRRGLPHKECRCKDKHAAACRCACAHVRTQRKALTHGVALVGMKTARAGSPHAMHRALQPFKNSARVYQRVTPKLHVLVSAGKRLLCANAMRVARRPRRDRGTRRPPAYKRARPPWAAAAPASWMHGDDVRSREQSVTKGGRDSVDGPLEFFSSGRNAVPPTTFFFKPMVRHGSCRTARAGRQSRGKHFQGTGPVPF